MSLFKEQSTTTGIRKGKNSKNQSQHEDKSVCKQWPVPPTLVQVTAQDSVVWTAEQEKTSLNITDCIS